MKIECVDPEFNSEYSKYITDIFDSVAYHDEPLFLKVQEIVKLVLAVEWLNEKLKQMDKSFSHIWMNKHLNKPRQQTNELVEVLVPSDEAEHLMNEAVLTEKQEDKQLATAKRLQVNFSRKDISQSGFQVEASATMGTETKEVEVRGTFNDFDFLFEGLNPNQPTNIDFDTMEPLIPNVQSWNELRRETVPCPCTASLWSHRTTCYWRCQHTRFHNKPCEAQPYSSLKNRNHSSRWTTSGKEVRGDTKA